ncbi:hypothetical protein LAZ67_5002459 [Cordylochernes scorpioides]|uniref:Uncharacterized protein n=1 Tax=Cordylochernes scorpioides TaxID=51811 RepID=A0ABY6KGE7_9ARAC|nr:hypothetical protein LAZ67_5002459 [Cordylochernes scorpioides]
MASAAEATSAAVTQAFGCPRWCATLTWGRWWREPPTTSTRKVLAVRRLDVSADSHNVLDLSDPILRVTIGKGINLTRVNKPSRKPQLSSPDVATLTALLFKGTDLKCISQTLQ